MKLKETSNYNEVPEELKQLCSKEFSFLKEYEKIDHMPDPKSIEIITQYSGGKRTSISETYTHVAKIEELIPEHLAKIKEQLLKGKKVYVRVMPEITLGKSDEVGLYTRLILI
jgi:hypothetical protein